MAILRKFTQLKFEPYKCESLIKNLIKKMPGLKDYLCTDFVDKNKTIGTKRLLKDDYQQTMKWNISYKTGNINNRTIVDTNQLRDEVVNWYALLERPEFNCVDGIWPEIKSPAAYRLEHASLLIKTNESQVIIDPTGYSPLWTSNYGNYPNDIHIQNLDAILITHMHNDHWHLPSILRHITPGLTKVIVPNVPHKNYLTPEDPSETLRILGIEYIKAHWHQVIKIGDIVITVLPFYGEQPTRRREIDSQYIRNWGACYRIDGPNISALILSDSGIDPRGSMIDVVRESCRIYGKVNTIFSNFCSFPEAINEGVSEYLLTIPFEILHEIFTEQSHGEIRSSTLGVEGLSEICAVAGADFVVPYAHGFKGIGKNVDYPQYNELNWQLKERELKTKLINWNPGEHFP